MTDAARDTSEVDFPTIFQSVDAMDPGAKYNMKHSRRGVALIFNHEHFYWYLGLPNRGGTNADRFNLERRDCLQQGRSYGDDFLKTKLHEGHYETLSMYLMCFNRLRDLGFDVSAYDNLKTMEVLETIHKVATSDHSDADCFLCIFLSHGENNHIFAYDGKINLQELTARFRGDKCSSLVGKPKIFIIQACRGDKHDDPVMAKDEVDSKTSEDSAVNEVVVDAATIPTLPAGADFVMCYSVAEGFYSHRETINGSWYVQDLCKILESYGSQLEFTELLTLVNRKVSWRSVHNCADRTAIGKKQVPCFASMLTKKLYFEPKTS